MKFYENYFIGMFVIMVIVIDKDLGNFVCVCYFVDDFEVVEKFSVDVDIGMIYSRFIFDCENLFYVFIFVFIWVIDGGGRFGFCIVEVCDIFVNGEFYILDYINFIVCFLILFLKFFIF